VEEMEKRAEEVRAEFRLPLTVQPVRCVNISLCEPRTPREIGSVGGHIEAG